MNNFWEKNKNASVVIIYLMVILGLFKFAIFPLVASIEEKRRGIEEREMDHELSEKKVREIPQLKDEIDSAKRSESKLDVFIRPDNILPLIESLENLSVETGNDIKIEILNEGSGKAAADSKNSKSKESEGVLGQLPGDAYVLMRINIAGDFKGAYAFMERLEDFKYFSDTISVKMRKADIRHADPSITKNPSNFIQNEVSQGRESIDSQAPKDVSMETVLDVVFYYQAEQGK